MSRLIRFGIGFAVAGLLIPIALLLSWGAWVYNTSPATQRLYREISVFVWPAGMALAGPGKPGYPMAEFAAIATTIVENMVMYAVLGLLIGYLWNWFRPEPARVVKEESKTRAAASGKGA